VDLLGDLYAFGLLGTFVLTCVSLDVVRWREREHWTRGHGALFAVGVLTTVLPATTDDAQSVLDPETSWPGASANTAVAASIAGFDSKPIRAL